MTQNDLLYFLWVCWWNRGTKTIDCVLNDLKQVWIYPFSEHGEFEEVIQEISSQKNKTKNQTHIQLTLSQERKRRQPSDPFQV